MSAIELISSVLLKVIPTNWYTTKKTCDLVTMVCNTIVQLKWFVFPTLVVVFLGVIFLTYSIIKHSD